MTFHDRYPTIRRSTKGSKHASQKPCHWWILSKILQTAFASKLMTTLGTVGVLFDKPLSAISTRRRSFSASVWRRSMTKPCMSLRASHDTMNPPVCLFVSLAIQAFAWICTPERFWPIRTISPTFWSRIQELLPNRTRSQPHIPSTKLKTCAFRWSSSL